MAGNDGYIGVRKADLIGAIVTAAPTAEAQAIGDVCKLLDALLHHEAHAHCFLANSVTTQIEIQGTWSGAN